jgi:hypothetical protein
MRALSGGEHWNSLAFMKSRSWILIGTLLALPALGLAEEPSAPKSIPPADVPATHDASPKSQSTFDLRTAAMQSIIRASAATASDGFRLMSPAAQQPSQDNGHDVTRPKLQSLPFRAPRRLHHMDCDSFNCVAYTADNQALYTISREQYFGINTDDSTDDSKEAWLSCQSGNDMLTTFERYDKCRGVSIGLPLQTHDVIVNLPKIRL